MTDDTIRKIFAHASLGLGAKDIARRLRMGTVDVQKVLSGKIRLKKGTKQKCPECGAKVFWPCRLCAWRQDPQYGKYPPAQPVIDDPQVAIPELGDPQLA